MLQSMYSFEAKFIFLVRTNPDGTVNTKELQIADKSDILVYPNPATDKIFIKTELLEPGIISVYNIKGDLVLYKQFDFTDRIELDIELLNSGIHFLAIKTDKKIYRKKFVKL